MMMLTHSLASCLRLCLPEVNIFTRLRGLLFGLIILITALFGCYLLMLYLPLLFLNKHKLWRRCMDRSIAFWLLLPVGLLHHMFGTRFRITGDVMSCDEPALIIMNHRTRLDWLYFWSALFKINPWLLTTEKISLKAQLGKIPGSGWAMAANWFIFLERDRELDAQKFSDAIDYYDDMDGKYQILLFPEGTDKSSWTTKKSVEHCKQRGMIPFEHVLCPRTAGFVHVLQKMRQSCFSANYITCVYDVTIAYPERIVQSELELGVKGLAPQKVHFNVKRIDVNEIPVGPQPSSDWLNQLWREKDEFLKEYYSKPMGKRRFEPEAEGFVWEHNDSRWQTFVRFYGMALWVMIFVAWSWHAFHLPLIQACLTCAIVTAFLIKLFYGGIDRMALFRWKRFKGAHCMTTADRSQTKLV